MNAVRRVLTMCEMHGRDLIGHHIAIALLIALLLSFYFSSASESSVSSGIEFQRK